MAGNVRTRGWVIVCFCFGSPAQQRKIIIHLLSHIPIHGRISGTCWLKIPSAAQIKFEIRALGTGLAQDTLLHALAVLFIVGCGGATSRSEAQQGHEGLSLDPTLWVYNPGRMSSLPGVSVSQPLKESKNTFLVPRGGGLKMASHYTKEMS